MIARFRVLLPYLFHIQQGVDLSPYEFTYGDNRVKIHPPRQAAVDPTTTDAASPVAARDVLEQLVPVEPAATTHTILMNGVPTIQTNLIQIDFFKPDFDRRSTDAHPDAQEDPPTGLIFELLNGFISAMRSVTQGGQIKPLTKINTYWRLDYLTDNSEELQAESGKFRRRFGSSISWRICGINEAIWGKVQTLSPTYHTANWETLLLDAEALLPDIGPSLVLAASALETLIESTLNHLASTANLPVGLWEWINNRGDYRKEPSVEEQFDSLLRILANKSLKDESLLWEAFKNLKDARNSFVHYGKAVIGKKETPVTQEIAYNLIGKAKEIVSWVELLLPADSRRPKIDQLIKFQMTKMIVAPTMTQPSA